MFITKNMASNWTKEEEGGRWSPKFVDEQYHGGSRLSTHVSHFQNPRGGELVPAEIHTNNMVNEVQSSNVVLRPNTFNVEQNNNLIMQLERANQTIVDLKKMLVKSYSDSKKRNLKRDVNENASRVSKVCREVIWPRVKFAPDSAFACFTERSIFDMVITNCNLEEDVDPIMFWCNNKDVVKDSLYQHRSNVTSRIKLQFRKGMSKAFTQHVFENVIYF